MAVAVAVFLAGAGYALTRQKTYQSTSSIALLPVSSNPRILPNYPTLIASLIPTYIELVSSPALLDQVALTLPFHISGIQLAQDVHAESSSDAAVINIVAQSPSPVQAQQIAARTTAAFLTKLTGNGVVVLSVYAQPVIPAKPAPPSTKLLLTVIFLLAVVLGLMAGLLYDGRSGDKDKGEGGAQHRFGDSPPRKLLRFLPSMSDHSRT